MARMVVSVFDSRREAERARERLREHGFKEAEIRVESGDSTRSPEASGQAKEPGAASANPGSAGAMERAFRGPMSDKDAARYAQAVRGGKSVVAVHAADEAAAARAAAMLDALALEADKTLSRAETYALPNSPVDWWESFEGEKLVLRGFPEDPGRPEEHILDAGALGTEELRELAEQAAQRAKDK